MRDESWTIAQTLGVFTVALLGLLWCSDGSIHLVTERFRSRRSAAVAPQMGESVAAMQPVVETAIENGTGTESTTPLRITDDSVEQLTAPGAGSSWLSDPCIDTTEHECKLTALGHFVTAAGSARRGHLGRTLRISMYGDSVVAADTIPHELRRRMWNEFGNGGPGFVYAAPPHRFCANESISRLTKGYWSSNSVSTSPVADGWYGVGNSSAATTNGTLRITVKDAAIDQVSLFFVEQPKGGTIALSTAQGALVSVPTNASTKTTVVKRIVAAQPFDSLLLQTVGPVRLFGMTLETGAGAVVDNLGVVSVSAYNFAKNEASHFAAQVAERDPDLIIIMMGANEAQSLGPTGVNTALYQSRYAAAIAPLTGRSTSSCLIVSPLDQAYVVGDGYASRPVMPKLVEAQRQAAAQLGCAFFSTYDWMGGKGAALRWLRRGLLGTDFQHLTVKGAEHLGAALFDALIPATR